MNTFEIGKQKLEYRNWNKTVLFFVLFSIFYILLSVPTAHASSLIKGPNNLGLVGYWSFEDGKLTKATDFSGKGNTGTLTNMEEVDWVSGKVGKALIFDGGASNEYVDTNFNWSSLVSNSTFSLWVKFVSITPQMMLAGSTANNYVYFDGTNLVMNSGGTDVGKTWSPAPVAGRWYHIVITRSGTTFQMYLDGAVLGTSGTLSTAFSSNSLRMGNWYNELLDLNGSLDEARIYNRALSAAEVRTLYNSTGVGRITSLVSNGLVGYWPLNTADISGTSVTDRSGNGKTGTINGTVTPTGGQTGGALSFNGSANYITTATISTPSAISAAAWVYSGNFGGNMFVIQKAVVNSQWQLFFENGNLYWATSNHDLSCTAPANNTWHHLVATQNGSSGRLYIDGVQCATGEAVPAIPQGTGLIWIGAHDSPAYYFSGKIDEVRLYNRQLSAAEVRALYRGAAVRVSTSQNTVASANLVLWHTFDGAYLNTTTSTDRSGQGNNGTLSGGPIPVIGKVGQALKFDGTDDYIDIGSVTTLTSGSPFSISWWEKINTDVDPYTTRFSLKMSGTSNYFIVERGNDSTYGPITWGTTNNSVKPLGTSPSVASSVGIWHHFVLSGSDPTSGSAATYTFYSDGVSLGTTNGGGWSVSQTNNRIGYIGQNYPTNATLDDVRIYNKALSASEVLQLYNQGK